MRLWQPRLHGGLLPRGPGGHHLRHRDPREAIEKARAGDERAIAGLAEIGRYLGIGISNATTIITPDLVILGGGWSSAGDLLIEPIKAEMRRRVLIGSGEHTEVVLAELGTWAGAIGAAVHGAEQAAREGRIEALG